MRSTPYRGHVVLFVVVGGLVVVSGMAAVGSPALDRQGSLTDATSSAKQAKSVTTNATPPTGEPAWRMTRANAANTMHINTTGPTNPITTRWTFAPEEENFAAGPVVINDTVYFGTKHVGGSETDKGKLYAVDAWTGEERWTFMAPSGEQPTKIAVFRNTVYVGTRGEKVHALDAATGDRFWTFVTAGRPRGLTVANRTLYVTGNHLYALGALRGEEHWRFKTDGKAVGPPAVKDGTVYVASRDNNMAALDAETGAVNWDVDVNKSSEQWLTAPSVANGNVYVGSRVFNCCGPDTGPLYALDIESGEERWKRTKPGTDIGTPSVLRNTVYFSTDYLHAADSQTGSDRWTKRNLKGTPVLLNDIGYIRTGGTLYTLDPATGAHQARFTPEPFNSSWDRFRGMAVLNGSLYTGVTIDDPGTGYRADRAIFYALGTPEFNYSNLSVTPQSPERNELVTATVTVRNTGTGPGEFNATLVVNGNVTNTTTARLNPRTSRTVTVAHTFAENGTYTVEIGGLIRRITVGDVEPAPTPTSAGDASSPTQTEASEETVTSGGSDNTLTAAATPTATSGSASGFGVVGWVVAVALVAVLVGIHKRD